MEQKYKTPEQVEFATLVQTVLERAKGTGTKINQSEIARRLELSPAAISKYLKGGTDEPNPSRRTLNDLRSIATKLQTTGELEPLEKREDRDIQEQIEFLRTHDPAGYQAAKLTVQALHTKAKSISSKQVYSGDIAPVSALQQALREERELRPSREAGETSGHKSGRGRGTRGPSSGKPGAQGPVRE